MVIELSPENIDTITNHRTLDSGNTVFASVTVVEPLEEPTVEPQYRLYTATAKAEIVSGFIVELTPSVVIGPGSKILGDRWVLVAESTIELQEFPDIIEPERLIGPVSPQDSINICGLIDIETNKLNIFSDGIGLALLAVLHKYGSMSITTILENLDRQRDDLVSHLSILENNQLVRIEEEQYCVTNEGLAFLSEFGLIE